MGEKKRSPFAVPDHGLNGIEEVFCGPIGIAEFTCPLQIVPSNLQRTSRLCIAAYRS